MAKAKPAPAPEAKKLRPRRLSLSERLAVRREVTERLEAALATGIDPETALEQVQASMQAEAPEKYGVDWLTLLPLIIEIVMMFLDMFKPKA